MQPQPAAPQPKAPAFHEPYLTEILVQQERLTSALSSLRTTSAARHVRIPRREGRQATTAPDPHLRLVARQLEAVLDRLDETLEPLGILERRADASLLRVSELDAQQAEAAAEAVEAAIKGSKGLASLVIEGFGSRRARDRFEQATMSRQALR